MWYPETTELVPINLDYQHSRDIGYKIFYWTNEGVLVLFLHQKWWANVIWLRLLRQPIQYELNTLLSGGEVISGQKDQMRGSLQSDQSQ